MHMRGEVTLKGGWVNMANSRTSVLSLKFSGPLTCRCSSPVEPSLQRWQRCSGVKKHEIVSSGQGITLTTTKARRFSSFLSLPWVGDGEESHITTTSPAGRHLITKTEDPSDDEQKTTVCKTKAHAKPRTATTTTTVAAPVQDQLEKSSRDLYLKRRQTADDACFLFAGGQVDRAVEHNGTGAATCLTPKVGGVNLLVFPAGLHDITSSKMAARFCYSASTVYLSSSSTTV